MVIVVDRNYSVYKCNFLLLFLQFRARIVTSDLEVDKTLEKVELRFAITTSGAQCVMTTGQTLMAMWSANRLDFHHMVQNTRIMHNIVG